jgi:kinesin family protein 18/19
MSSQQPSEGKVYEFDHVFDERASQDDVYRATTAPLVASVFEGYCATVFAYGATSSGKTHTMVGTPTDPGIMKRSIDDIFEISSDPERERKTEVT